MERLKLYLECCTYPNLERNFISIRNMDVTGVKTVCGDGGCKMVWGSMVLMRGFWYGTLYKLLGKPIINECNNYVVLEEGGKDDITLTASAGKTMLWHQRLGHIGEKGLWELQGKGMVEGLRIALWILISVNIAYMEKKSSKICFWCYNRKGNYRINT